MDEETKKGRAFERDFVLLANAQEDTAFGYKNAGYGDLYYYAVEIVESEKKASASYLQRRLQIGYSHAADLIDRMEREGIVTPPDHYERRYVTSLKRRYATLSKKLPLEKDFTTDGKGENSND